MSSPFLRALNQAARGAKSTTEKGRVLEEATKHFLTFDVVQQHRFDNVRLWDEYSGRKKGRKKRRDTGVDLVAIERKTGKRKTGRRIAIQCKFYASKNVGWDDIGTFVASCSKRKYAAGILVITTKLTEEARLELREIPTPIEVWYPEEFDDSNIEWDHWANRHRTKPSIEEAFNDIRSGWHRPKPSIEDLPVPPRPYPSRPDYGPRRIRQYSADRSPGKKPSILAPLSIICVIASVVIVVLIIRVKEVVERAVVGVDVSATISMLLTRAEDALRIIVAIVIVLGIFAFYGAFHRR